MNGKSLQLIFEDDGSRFDRGRSAAEKLITRDQVVALTGGYSSPVTFAVASLAQKRRIPFLVTTGSADMGVCLPLEPTGKRVRPSAY